MYEMCGVHGAWVSIGVNVMLLIWTAWVARGTQLIEHTRTPCTYTLPAVKFQWRIGDLINPQTHPESPKCFIDKQGKGDK